MDDTTPLLPVTDDRDTGGFFDAARRGVLAVRTCSSCHTILHLPRAYCKACGSWDGEWREVAGTGTVHSWTVVEHQVHPRYPTPHTIVLVDVDGAPGVRLVGHLPGTPELRDGLPMRVRFDDLGEGVVLPQWEPIG